MGKKRLFMKQGLCYVLTGVMVATGLPMMSPSVATAAKAEPVHQTKSLQSTKQVIEKENTEGSTTYQLENGKKETHLFS